MSTHTTSAIERAAALVDGVANLADACGVSAQAVYKWIKRGHPPTDRCEAIERAVGGQVSRFDLLPTTFTAPPKPTRKPTQANHRSTDPEPPPGRAGRKPKSTLPP